MLLTPSARPHRHGRPHPARRQLRRTVPAVPMDILADRLAGEYAARSVGLPRPGLAAWWRWRAECRGEGAMREVGR